MDTRERIEVRPSPRIPRRRGLAFGLAAIAVVAAVAGSDILHCRRR